jgi:hypothetical protein
LELVDAPKSTSNAPMSENMSPMGQRKSSIILLSF